MCPQSVYIFDWLHATLSSSWDSFNLFSFLHVHSVGEVMCSSPEETTVAVSAFILQVLIYLSKVSHELIDDCARL